MYEVTEPSISQVLPNPHLDVRAPIRTDIYRLWIWRKLRRHFHQIYVYGIHKSQVTCNSSGAILVYNHSSHLDSSLCFILSEYLGKRAFLFHPAEDIEANPFLRWFGFLPLNRASLQTANRQLKQAQFLCMEPTQLWISLQERPHPAHQFPTDSKHDIKLLARTSELPIIPVSIHAFFMESEKPTAFIVFGKTHSFQSIAMLEDELLDGLHKIDEFTEEHWHPLFQPSSWKFTFAWPRWIVNTYARWRLPKSL